MPSSQTARSPTRADPRINTERSLKRLSVGAMDVPRLTINNQRLSNDFQRLIRCGVGLSLTVS